MLYVSLSASRGDGLTIYYSVHSVSGGAIWTGTCVCGGGAVLRGRLTFLVRRGIPHCQLDVAPSVFRPRV